MLLQNRLPAKYYDSRKIYGMEQQGYFIDIGIPEDYLKAQTELTN